jgi:hypothetical protein
MHHCHCARCRKTHGAAFSTFARVARGDFRFTRGEALVRGFRSSPPVERTFCERCGSKLTFRFDGLPDAVWVAAGTFDDDPGIRPRAHVFVGSKACWHEITDGLPCFEEYAPEG